MANDVGIKIFRQEAKFIAGAARPDQLPKIALPQVAFVGKSNVGKSSLINTICRRKNLANQLLNQHPFGGGDPLKIFLGDPPKK